MLEHHPPSESTPDTALPQTTLVKHQVFTGSNVRHSFTLAKVAIDNDSLAQGKAAVRHNNNGPIRKQWVCCWAKRDGCKYKVSLGVTPKSKGTPNSVRITNINGTHTCTTGGKYPGRLGLNQAKYQKIELPAHVPGFKDENTFATRNALQEKLGVTLNIQGVQARKREARKSNGDTARAPATKRSTQDIRIAELQESLLDELDKYKASVKELCCQKEGSEEEKDRLHANLTTALVLAREGHQAFAALGRLSP